MPKRRGKKRVGRPPKSARNLTPVEGVQGSTIVDLNIVKDEPGDLNVNDELAAVDPIDKLEQHLDEESSPVASRKSSRLKERLQSSTTDEKPSRCTSTQGSPAKSPNLVKGIKLEILDFSQDCQDDDEDLDSLLFMSDIQPHQNVQTYPDVFSGPMETQVIPFSNNLISIPSNAICTNSTNNVVMSLEDDEKYNNLPHEDALSLLKRYVSNSRLDEATIKGLERNNIQQSRTMGQLLEENLSLKKSVAEYQLVSEKERWRATEAWKNAESTKLYTKATEEGSMQRFFLREKYTEAIEGIRTDCEKRLRELEKERSQLSRENAGHTRRESRMKASYSKMKKKVEVLRTLVRTFSCSVSMFVELEDLDLKLGILGGNIYKRYKEAIEEKGNAKELNVAKQIAQKTGRMGKRDQVALKSDTSETDSSDEFIEVENDLIEEEKVVVPELKMKKEETVTPPQSPPLVPDSTLSKVKDETSTPPQSPPIALPVDPNIIVKDEKISPPQTPDEISVPEISVESKQVCRPPSPFSVIPPEFHISPVRPSIFEPDDPIPLPWKEGVATASMPDLFKPPASQNASKLAPLDMSMPSLIGEELAIVKIPEPVTCTPDKKHIPAEEKIEEDRQSPEDYSKIKVPIVSTTPKYWGKKMVTYTPYDARPVQPVTLPQERMRYNPSVRAHPFLPRDYASLSTQFTLVSPIVTPPIRKKPAETFIPKRDEDIEHDIEFHTVPSSENQPSLSPPKADALEIPVQVPLPLIPSTSSAFVQTRSESIETAQESDLNKNTSEIESMRLIDEVFMNSEETPHDNLDKLVEKEHDEKESFEEIEMPEEDPNNPIITHWDSDKSERATPPIVLLTRRYRRNQRIPYHNNPRRDHEDRRGGNQSYQRNMQPRSRYGSNQRTRQPPPQPPRNTSMSVRSRLNAGLGIINPAKDSRECEKMKLDKHIRKNQAKKRGREASSSDECTKKKKPRIQYSMTDLFGEETKPTSPDHASSDTYADVETSDDENHPHKDLQISDHEIQPPASPDPTPRVTHHPQLINHENFNINHHLVGYLTSLMDYTLDVILVSDTNLTAVDPVELATAVYVTMVQTQEHEYLANISSDQRVSLCPLIPKFQTLFAVVKMLPSTTITGFLEFFITRVIPNDLLRELENDQLLVNIGRFMGAITLFLKNQTYGLNMLFNFLLYRPPFAFSFAHGLLCSDLAVIGYTDFWQFEDLSKKTQAILFSIFKHPRFGDARYAKPVIEMIKRSLSINVPDLTFEQFLWKLVEFVFTVESDRELNNCADIISMLVVQKGAPFFEDTFTTRFYDWTKKWNEGEITDGVFACFINTVGIIAEALRRSDIPISTEKQQAVLRVVGKIEHAPQIVQVSVNNSILKLRNVKEGVKKEVWEYEKRKQPGAATRPPAQAFMRKKYKKSKDSTPPGDPKKQFRGEKKQSTWVRGSRSSPKQRKFKPSSSRPNSGGKGDWRKGSWKQRDE